MKKIVLFSMLLLGMLFLNGCKEKKVVAVAESAPIVVEQVTGADREYMFLNYGGEYRWYESCILLKNYLDEENDGEVAGVSNVFQVVTNQDEHGADVHVILISHTETANDTDVREGFWVGDFPLNPEPIQITFQQAFELVQQVNLPKPHSRHCVLRREIGPVADVNPQYIFGNTQAQIYVDAVTGEVSDENPAFKGFGFKMPLGEWP